MALRILDKNKKDTKVAISQFNYAPKPKNYQVQIIGVKEARKGYPNRRVGITKKMAERIALNYMRRKK